MHFLHFHCDCDLGDLQSCVRSHSVMFANMTEKCQVRFVVQQSVWPLRL